METTTDKIFILSKKLICDLSKEELLEMVEIFTQYLNCEKYYQIPEVDVSQGMQKNTKNFGDTSKGIPTDKHLTMKLQSVSDDMQWYNDSKLCRAKLTANNIINRQCGVDTSIISNDKKNKSTSKFLEPDEQKLFPKLLGDVETDIGSSKGYCKNVNMFYNHNNMYNRRRKCHKYRSNKICKNDEPFNESANKNNDLNSRLEQNQINIPHISTKWTKICENEHNENICFLRKGIFEDDIRFNNTHNLSKESVTNKYRRRMPVNISKKNNAYWQQLQIPKYENDHYTLGSVSNLRSECDKNLEKKIWGTKYSFLKKKSLSLCNTCRLPVVDKMVSHHLCKTQFLF